MQDDPIEAQLNHHADGFFERSLEESLVVQLLPVQETIIREVMIKRCEKKALLRNRQKLLDIPVKVVPGLVDEKVYLVSNQDMERIQEEVARRLQAKTRYHSALRKGY